MPPTALPTLGRVSYQFAALSTLAMPRVKISSIGRASYQKISLKNCFVRNAKCIVIYNAFAHPTQQSIVIYNTLLILKSADRCYLWVSFHHAILRHIIPERNYQFEVMLGEVETRDPRKKPANLGHVRLSPDPVSRPAGRSQGTVRTLSG